jgi:hypothetical protein
MYDVRKWPMRQLTVRGISLASVIVFKDVGNSAFVPSSGSGFEEFSPLVCTKIWLEISVLW